jgi:hypothetical protein
LRGAFRQRQITNNHKWKIMENGKWEMKADRISPRGTK